MASYISNTVAAGLLLALLTQRCLFSDAGFFLHMFADTSTYDWHQHYQRLVQVGRPMPSIYQIDINSAASLTDWLLQNQTELLMPFQAVVLEGDFDYSAPFLLVSDLMQLCMLRLTTLLCFQDWKMSNSSVFCRQILCTKTFSQRLSRAERSSGRYHLTCLKWVTLKFSAFCTENNLAIAHLYDMNAHTICKACQELVSDRCTKF